MAAVRYFVKETPGIERSRCHDNAKVHLMGIPTGLSRPETLLRGQCRYCVQLDNKFVTYLLHFYNLPVKLQTYLSLDITCKLCKFRTMQ